MVGLSLSCTDYHYYCSLGEKGTTNLSYVTSPQLRVATVISDHTPPLVLSYDTRDNTHTLWAIQTATSNVINYSLSINYYNYYRIYHLLHLPLEAWPGVWPQDHEVPR